MSQPLYKKIQEDLLGQILAGEYRDGDRIPSESELMEHYFVSAITVKTALNNLVDQGVIYRIKGKGSFVAEGLFSESGKEPVKKSITIGVVLPTMSTRVEQYYMLFLDRYCNQYGYNLLMRCSNESPDQEVKILRRYLSMGVNGFILFPVVSEISNATIRQLIAKSFPFVLLDRYLDNLDVPYVVCNNEQGALLAAKHLQERVGREMTMVHYPLCNSAVTDRFNAYRQAFEDLSLDFDGANHCQIDDLELLNGDFMQRTSYLYQAIEKHLLDYPRLRGLFAANAEIAQVAYYVVCRQGYLVGRDFHIVSFDNAYLPGVCFIQQDFPRLVKESIDLLHRRIEGKDGGAHRVVDVQLIETVEAPKPNDGLHHLIMSFVGLEEEPAQGR
ncbi:MAG: GntR family transcriptional regulator [Candidatus Limiplasma sp.]|nr:GntR family transcriptional regulator [Candidatus Limiplasma sp.]